MSCNIARFRCRGHFSFSMSVRRSITILSLSIYTILYTQCYYTFSNCDRHNIVEYTVALRCLISMLASSADLPQSVRNKALHAMFWLTVCIGGGGSKRVSRAQSYYTRMPRNIRKPKELIIVNRLPYIICYCYYEL
jgi:hypothetical protein